MNYKTFRIEADRGSSRKWKMYTEMKESEIRDNSCIILSIRDTDSIEKNITYNENIIVKCELTLN